MINSAQLRNMRKSGVFGYAQNTKPLANGKESAFSPFLVPFLLACLFLLVMAGCAWASEPVDVNRLANAIYITEGGANTRHPYGILKKYKTTTPRQACINTINHRLKDWILAGRPGDFISYLGGFYAPIGADNDPQGLNKNWIRNVQKLYERGEK